MRREAKGVVPDVRTDLAGGGHRGTGLVDVLDRVLDKGLLIAGDIRVSLAEVELLTIRIRLIVCSIDKAQEIGLDWWKHDRNLAPGARAPRWRTEALRRQVRSSSAGSPRSPRRRSPARRRASRKRAGRPTAATGG